MPNVNWYENIHGVVPSQRHRRVSRHFLVDYVVEDFGNSWEQSSFNFVRFCAYIVRENRKPSSIYQEKWVCGRCFRFVPLAELRKRYWDDENEVERFEDDDMFNDFITFCSAPCARRALNISEFENKVSVEIVPIDEWLAYSEDIGSRIRAIWNGWPEDNMDLAYRNNAVIE